MIATALTTTAGLLYMLTDKHSPESPGVPSVPSLPGPSSTLWTSVWKLQTDVSEDLGAFGGPEGLVALGERVTFTRLPGGSVAAIVAQGQQEDIVGVLFIIGELNGVNFTGLMATVPVTGTFSDDYKTFTLQIGTARLVWTI